MVQCIDTKTLLVLLLKLIIIVLLLHPKCSSSSIEENLTNMLTQMPKCQMFYVQTLMKSCV